MNNTIDIKSIFGAMVAVGLMFWVLRRTIGWSDLKNIYAFSGSINPIVTRRLTTCWMNGIRGSYNLCANLKGLHISFPFPFNIGRSPIFIPWEDISVQRGETLLVARDMVELSFSKIPNTCFQIKSKVFKGIADSVGNRLEKK